MSDDHIGEKLTVSKHCCLYIYTILTWIYVLYCCYWTLFFYKYSKQYIYIYIYVWLNNKDTFFLYIFIKILSSFLINVLVSGWNWWMIFTKIVPSAFGHFGKFIRQFQPETKTLIRKLEKILMKLYRKNVSLLFNQICLNERQLPNYTHTHTHTHIYIYIYIYE